MQHLLPIRLSALLPCTCGRAASASEFWKRCFVALGCYTAPSSAFGQKRAACELTTGCSALRGGVVNMTYTNAAARLLWHACSAPQRCCSLCVHLVKGYCIGRTSLLQFATQQLLMCGVVDCVRSRNSLYPAGPVTATDGQSRLQLHDMHS